MGTCDAGNGCRHHWKGLPMRQQRCALFALVFFIVPIPTIAESSYDMGKAIYLDNCASCHGMTGQGDGPLRPFLSKPPSDLTLMTRRNQGIFPHQRLWESIDGRGFGDSGPHGSRDMPIWGREFRAQSARESGGCISDANPYGVLPYGGLHRGHGVEWRVHQKISSLVDYIARIQSP
jgi:hypothetical protein